MSSFELPQRVSAARPPKYSTVPAHLQCNSCSGSLFNGFQTPHGCRLCQTCVTSLLPATEKRLCPGKTEACRDETEEIELSQTSCLPDMATRREVSRLVVTCPNTDAGCNEKLKWAQVDKHLDECNFQSISCELCSKQVVKKDMQRHKSKECEQRKVKCDRCSQLVAFRDMQRKHNNLESDECCAKFSAPCPHCGDRSKTLTRRAYVLHLSECPEKPLDCKYAHLGCTVRVRRSDLESHYRSCSDAHLTLLDSKLKQVGFPQAAVVSAATPANSGGGTGGGGGGVRELTETARKVECMQEHFRKMQINVANWAHTMLEFEQIADRYRGINNLRETVQGFSDRLRRLEDRSRRAPTPDQGSRDIDASPTTSTSRQDQLPLMEEASGFQLQRRLLAMEARLESLEHTCYDGRLVWRITHLASRRRASGTPCLSVPFFLRRFGPAFRVRLFLSGNESGSGSHLSVYLVSVWHEFDDVQDWPVVAEATFRLVNMADRRRDIVKSVRVDTSGIVRPTTPKDLSVCFGEPRLLPLSEFNKAFVRDDCCYLEVGVAELSPDGSIRERPRRAAARRR